MGKIYQFRKPELEDRMKQIPDMTDAGMDRLMVDLSFPSITKQKVNAINEGLDILGRREYARLRNKGWSMELLINTGFMSWGTKKTEEVERDYMNNLYKSAALPTEIDP